MFGLSRSVNTLGNAVSVVGTAHIRARALAVCLANTMVFPPNMNRLEFWRHSMVCAGYCRWLAANAGQDEAQAWLTGMMLRLGELIIAQKQPDAIAHIELQPCAPGERWRREREQTGFDEGQITAEIARRWDFPETIANALGGSGHPSPHASSRLASVVHIGALLADHVGSPTEALDQLPFVLVQVLRLDVEALRTHMPAPESFSDISALLG